MNKQELTASAEKELSALSDQELLDEAKKLKSFSITNAFFIGFLVGILVFSFTKNSWSLVSLIPLFLIYKLVNDPKNIRAEALDKILQQRNLK